MKLDPTKVMATFTPSQTRMVRTSPWCFHAISSTAPIIPKIAPEAPMVVMYGSENHVTTAEPVNAETR